MALVSYDFGSDSEGGEDEEPLSIETNSNSKVNGEKTETGNAISSDEDENTIPVSNGTTTNMFDKLPQKREHVLEVYEDKVEDFIPKAKVPEKKRAPVKISIPSLSDFNDLNNEEPSFKKLKPSAKGSGLLSILPPVKCVPMSNKSFIPNVLSQKNKVLNNQVKKIVKPNTAVKAELKTKVKANDSDDSDEDIDLPETFDEELWQKTCGKVVKKDIIEPEPIIDEPIINLAPEPVKPYDGLDNVAFKELVGKRSRIPRNIKLIDVNEEELVADKDLWMTKSLTDPDFVPKQAVEDPVDPTKRKKHHITYLAQQAKANEQELQSQWASSKFNRNQSRAKYGF
ncbi:hypothetical protein HHI36_018931 [Cryptolaemus montrouzieri]|uniref:Proline-rich protein PRCC n=1 Tax=Cryptolaemus montrouzieri TaxID=559131 RepID=A0ABD2P1F3_9CUCU